MPIDFAAIADSFKATAALEARRASLAQQAIAGPLGKRLSAARQVDAATRQFPIIRFYNGAPVMRVTSSQVGSLAVLRPPPSVGHGIVDGAFGFLRGFAQIWAPLKSDSQESALRRFSTSLNDALKAAEASIGRFEHPTPEMFDPRRAQAGDIIGLAVLAFRALDQASTKGGEIDVLTSQVARAMGIVRAAPPPLSGEQAQADVAPAPARSLQENLDSAAYSLLGGFVILASLPQLVDTLFRGVMIRTRAWLLDEFTAIEGSMLEFRTDMLRRSTAGVVAWANASIDLLGGIHEVLGANVTFMLTFWRAYSTQFASSVRDFTIKLVQYFQDWVTLLKALPGVLGAVTAFDLTLLLRDALGGVVDYVPTLALDDLLDSTGTRVNVAKFEQWMSLMDTAELGLDAAAGGVTVLGGLVGYLLARKKLEYGRRQIDRVRRLMLALFPGASWNPLLLGTTRMIPPAYFLSEAPPLDFKADFPNLYETLMGSGRAARFVAIIEGLGVSAGKGLTQAIQQGREGLDLMAKEMEQAAARAANIRDEERLRRAAQEARKVADKVFGPEVDRQRESLGKRRAGPLALAFEGWLAGGGFQLIGEVIPVYIREMSAYWQHQVQAGEELTAPVMPTSPHILRQRAVLGKVAVPRITVRSAPRRDLDESLLESVREAFQAAVERCYTTGRRRLGEIAATGAAAGAG